MEVRLSAVSMDRIAGSGKRADTGSGSGKRAGTGSGRDLRAALLAFLAIAPVAAGQDAAAAARRPMTAADLWAMQRVGAPVVSPDGSVAAFPVTTYSGDDFKANSDLWLVATDGSEAPRQLTFQAGSDGAPAFSPDGRSLLFLSKRGDGPAQLHLLPLDGGEATRLTDLPVTPQSAKWSGDGRTVFFAATTWPDLDGDFDAVKARLDAQKDAVQVHVSESRILRYWDHYVTDGSVTHLFALDVASRRIRDLTPGRTGSSASPGPTSTCRPTARRSRSPPTSPTLRTARSTWTCCCSTSRAAWSTT